MKAKNKKNIKANKKNSDKKIPKNNVLNDPIWELCGIANLKIPKTNKGLDRAIYRLHD